MNKVLVVGSWAKEQITIENIVKKGDANCYAYMDTCNPGIIGLAEGYRIGDLKNVENIADYAKSISADLVLITTASSLASGAVDRLEEKGIRTFGPTRSAARLESDKAFARELVAKYSPGAVPEFSVFEDVEKAMEFAHTFDWRVAVKSIGLAEGLGVKVVSGRMKRKEEAGNYIRDFLKANKKETRIIVEEFIEGEEFTVQCLVNNDVIIPTPVVQDFKRLLPGDKGPNTASMGSYSDRGDLLPFLTQKDYDKALEIIRATVDGFHDHTGEVCQGFLYGQFMLTSKGIKLIEYNFRPGDPEWINTLSVLKDSVIDTIEAIMAGEEKKIYFEDKATVCKYIVPLKYPRELNKTLDIIFDEEQIKKDGIGVYYSCGRDKEGKLKVGSERGIAFLAKADTIPEAARQVENAITAVRGEFHHRPDIGTERVLREKKMYVSKMLGRKQ